MEETPTTVNQTLEQRGSRYGSFEKNAAVAQTLKRILFSALAENSQLNEPIPPYMAEGLEMIAHKLSRIVNGDPFYDDSWHDISGYAQLVEQALKKQ